MNTPHSLCNKHTSTCNKRAEGFACPAFSANQGQQGFRDALACLCVLQARYTHFLGRSTHQLLSDIFLLDPWWLFLSAARPCSLETLRQAFTITGQRVLTMPSTTPKPHLSFYNANMLKKVDTYKTPVRLQTGFLSLKHSKPRLRHRTYQQRIHGARQIANVKLCVPHLPTSCPSLRSLRVCRKEKRGSASNLHRCE